MRDTSHAIWENVNSVRSYLDNGKSALRPYFDLKKAFDSVHHNILF